jgi:hypothetical protein
MNDSLKCDDFLTCVIDQGRGMLFEGASSSVCFGICSAPIKSYRGRFLDRPTGRVRQRAAVTKVLMSSLWHERH